MVDTLRNVIRGGSRTKMKSCSCNNASVKSFMCEIVVAFVFICDKMFLCLWEISTVDIT